MGLVRAGDRLCAGPEVKAASAGNGGYLTSIEFINASKLRLHFVGVSETSFQFNRGFRHIIMIVNCGTASAQDIEGGDCYITAMQPKCDYFVFAAAL
ncbi:hypothetical protein D7M11_21220 [Paenibacillus ginsengarvi]|uniref:Uncharacterized protein n=1 Tax=Paenibacillus ginsengarvi TaxID=400777 RepID=A0A3B0C079_9BACL|nr:hypothetical protein D7M11_21220 [Paenibacillus ginsengarvi]